MREGTEGGAGGEEGAAIAAPAVASFIDLPLLVGQRLENCEAKIFAKPPTKKTLADEVEPFLTLINFEKFKKKSSKRLQIFHPSRKLQP